MIAHPRRILLLGGKERLVPAIDCARGLGLEVLMADGNPLAPGIAAADKGFAVDISDAEAITSLARREHVDAVLSLSEFGVVSAAIASDSLNLSGISIAAAQRATNKALMRNAWKQSGLSQPAFVVVAQDDDYTVAADKLARPLIVKPCWSSAGRGVTRVLNDQNLEQAVRKAQAVDREQNILLEDFIPATQYNCEGFVNSAGYHLLTVCDKVIETTDECVTWGHFYGPVESALEQRLQNLLEEAVAAIGIEQGCVHAEVLVNDDGCFLLELAARGGGGDIYTTIVRHCSGFDLLEASILAALGQDITVQRSKQHRAAAYEFLQAPVGRLVEIHGVEEAKQVQGVSDIQFIVQPGDDLESTTDGAHRPGWIVVLADTHQQTKEAVRQAKSLIKFVVE